MKLRLLGGLPYVDMELRDAEIHIDAMDYGFPIQGILGLDFLLRVRAVIALDALRGALGPGEQHGLSLSEAIRDPLFLVNCGEFVVLAAVSAWAFRKLASKSTIHRDLRA